MAGNSKRGYISHLWRVLRYYKAQVVLLSILSLLSAMFEAGFIVLLTSLALSLVEGQETVGPMLGQTLERSTALWIAGGALLLRGGLGLLTVRISAHLTADITTEQRQQLSAAYLNASWDLQHAEPSGRLQELLTSFVGRVNWAVRSFITAMTASLSLAAFLASGFVMDPIATGSVVLMLGVVSLVLIPLRQVVRRRSWREAGAGVEFAKFVAELGSLGMEMQTFGVERSFQRFIDKLTREASAAQRQTAVLTGALPHIYISLAYAAVLVGVAALSQVAVADFAVLGAILLLMLRSISYGQQLASASAQLSAALPFLEEVEATEVRYSASKTNQGTQRPPSAAPIAFVQVGFRYTPERPAISGVNFVLDPGEVLGVIGPSGAGKSTMAQLVLGLRTPTEGDIQIHGVQQDDIDRKWWTDRVASVPQEAKLFTGTVAENIRFFREGLDPSAMREAARKANVLLDIEALPDGFDTHLGERGGQLSGGQKQRLSIARALIGRPEVLVLDEPTSALDGESEALIRETLRQLRGEVSIVLIAHRMSTLDICDRIMVVENGEVTGLGTPAELRSQSGFYRKALAVAGLS